VGAIPGFKKTQSKLSVKSTVKDVSRRAGKALKPIGEVVESGTSAIQSAAQGSIRKSSEAVDPLINALASGKWTKGTKSPSRNSKSSKPKSSSSKTKK